MSEPSTELVHLTINHIPVAVPKGTKIMQAAAKIHIDIPHLCYHEDQRIKAHCRLCSVEVTGRRRLYAACSTECWEGMEVHTDTPIVRNTQIAILQLMLANHNRDCLSCPRNQNCDLQHLVSRFNILRSPLPSVVRDTQRIVTNPSIVRDPSKCILCGLCVRTCAEIQNIGAVDFSGRGKKAHISADFGKTLMDTDCVGCGQCASVCPTGAITIRNETEKFWSMLQDKNRKVVVQYAPSVRAGMAERFGLPANEPCTGKLVAALRRLGADVVYDTNLTADLTIMEESAEFLEKVKSGAKLPMFTSCCPGWI